MFGALRDCVPPMMAVKHVTATELMESFDKEVYDQMKEVCETCYLKEMDVLQEFKRFFYQYATYLIVAYTV